MSLTRNLANKLHPTVTTLPIALKHLLSDYKNVSHLLGRVRKYKKCTLADNSESNKRFFKSLKQYCYFFNFAGADKYLDSYFEESGPVILKKTYNNDIPDDEVILICCVRNDIGRIKKLYQHHKDIGIKYMIFVDNMSDDGTKEWLLDQEVDLYQISEIYHAGRKAAWVRKIQDIYGYNRWYLIVDSDELFTYVGCEKHSINELAKYSKDKGYKRIKSMLLDMYSDHEAYINNCDISEFDKEYVYFDSDTYYEARDCRGEMVRGGARPRVFNYGKGYDNPLTKYPLIYAEYEDVWGDHTPVPFAKNFGCPMISVLRHYKFMAGDKEKYKENVANGNYYGGSLEYKCYLKKEDGITFHYQDSKKYDSSESLMEIGFMERIWPEQNT